MKLPPVCLAMLLISGVIPTAYARSCDDQDRDKAEYFAEQAGKEIVEEYGGGQDQRTKLTSCSYNSYSREFKLKIEVYWNGAIFRSNSYNVDGELKLRSDGSQVSFSKTYESQSVKDMAFSIGVIGGALMLSSLADESGSAARGYPIRYKNECSKPLRLLIRYDKTGTGWVTEGWWEFSPNESAYLRSDGNTLRTNNEAIYYYVESTDGGDLKSVGEHIHYYQGQAYKMRKIVDKQGETSWTTTC